MASSLPPLVQAFSGALASAASNTASYPLDLAATKAQTTRNAQSRGLRGAIRILNHIIRSQGIYGLYDGLGADTASTLLSNFLYFYFYTLLHAIVARKRSGASSVSLYEALKRAVTSPTKPVLLGVPTELAVGFVAGVASRAVSTPLSVVTVRLQSGGDDEDEDEEKDEEKAAPKAVESRSRTLTEVVRSIYSTQGIRGFWAGFAPTFPLALTPALTLLFFQLLRRLRMPLLSSPSRASLRAFVDGACANALALTILYPLVLAKVRVQAWRGEDGPSMLDVWRAAHARRGWAGLYDGLAAQLVKGFVSQGVTMMVKQRIEQMIVRMYLRGRLSRSA